MASKYILILITCLAVSCNTNTKSENSLTEETADLHFSTQDFKKSQRLTTQNTDRFILNKNKFLSINFTLEKPLVESLRTLAPNLTVDQLLENGNFQFSFIVDDELIYVENLNKGAGLVDSKTKQLKHTIPFVSPEQLDFWGWFMWLKFMKLGGGRDVLIEGNHNLKIEVRPYLKRESLLVGELLARGDIALEVEKIPIDESLIPIQNIQPNSGWEISQDSLDSNKIEALNRKIAENRFENINGIVVIKNGKLLLEEYFNDETRNSLHDPRSVGKSIASSILGIAIDEGYIKNENALLKDFYDLKDFKNYSNKKDSITLKSLLTMSSAFLGDDSDYSSPGNEENMYPTKNWVNFTLNLPMDEDKIIGKDFAYFTAGVVILGDALNKAVPNGLVDYADQKMFAPLGITNYKWEYTPQNVGNTAGGIRLTALDFAKYGQLYKNNGLWNGKQILSKEWVKKSLNKQVKQSIDGDSYGYLFWNKTFTVNNKDYDVSFCSGNGGNKVFIFKAIPFVVVITASAYNAPDSHANANKIMTEYILPSILDQ